MANTTRGNIAIIGFRSSGVALKTRRMCIEACWDRKCSAAARRAMAAGAAKIAHSHVPRMIEFHIKAA
jgi:hypothetical protein